MKIKTSYIDLCDSAKEIFYKFGFEKVKDTKQPIYERFGMRYIPTAVNKLKKVSGISKRKEEIYYRGQYYILSRKAAEILRLSQSTTIEKLKRHKARYIKDDYITYWLKSDVIDLKNGQLIKDDYKFLDNCNDLIFAIVTVGNGQKLISQNGEIKISLNLRLFKNDSTEAVNNRIDTKPDEVFKHLPRKTLKDNHYLIGDKETIINLTTGRLLNPAIKGVGYRYTFIDDKQISTHRLIGLLFIPNPKDKEKLHHIDEDKLNNDIDNLVWVTSKEHKKCHLLLDDIKTAKTKTARLKAERAYRKYIKQLRRDNSQA